MMYEALDEGLHMLFHSVLTTTLGENTIIVSVFQPRELKHKAIKQQAQSPLSSRTTR